MSQQAGSHKQDSSVLHVSRRHMTPQVLKAGVTPAVANRVKELHLRLEQAEDMLPEWLDVIATKFPNLKHLILTKGEDDDEDDEDHNSDDDEEHNNENVTPAKKVASEQPMQLRRLYILYRLPQLTSIDNVPVTKSERRLARPDDPNGNRVSSREPEDWFPLSKNNNKSKNKSPQKSSNPPSPQNPTKSRTVKNNKRSQSKGLQESEQDEEKEQQQTCALNQLQSVDSEKEYELGADLANAIQRITEPRKNSQRKASPNHDKPDATKTGGGKQHHTDRRILTGATNGSKDNDRANYVVVDNRDSTVASTYGCGHWGAACFAPFQVCTTTGGQLRAKKTNETVSARQHRNENNTNHNSNKRENKGASLSSLRESRSGISPQPSKSYKYSSLVDKTLQEEQLQEERRRLSRGSTMSHDESTLPSSRRSKKYSKVLEQSIDEETRCCSQDDEENGNRIVEQKPRRRSSGPARQSEAEQQIAIQAKPRTKDKTSQSNTKPQHEAEAPVLDDDEVGTMTGVSICVERGANSSISVATIPAVLRRQAAKIESKNLAARRNMTGVTIDVPPQTPNDAQKIPTNKPNHKLKKQTSDQKVDNDNYKAKKFDNATKKLDDDEIISKAAKTKSKSSNTKKGEDNEVAAKKAPEPITPINSVQETIEATETMKSLDGPTDQEIVDMVLKGKPLLSETKETLPSLSQGVNMKTTSANYADGMMQKLMRIETNLQIDTLTPQDHHKHAKQSQLTPGENSVTSSEARNAKIYNKVKANQTKKKLKEKQTSPDAQKCSTGNFQEMESRLNSLINKPSKLSASSMLPSLGGQPSHHSENDQTRMADTVSKSDANRKNSAPITHRRKHEKKFASPVRQRQSTTATAKSPAKPESSPLEKLETSMAGLFATLIGQMSPQRRALPSPISGSRTMPEKNKKHDSFFSKDIEKTLNRLAGDKSKDDDSTLFVVEIQRKDVTESLTHDPGIRPGKDKIHIEAPSVIKVSSPTAQSSITNFSLSPKATVRFPSPVVRAGQQINPHIIDLTDNSSITPFPNTGSPEVINLVDVANQYLTLPATPAKGHVTEDSSEPVGTDGNLKATPGIETQGSKLGLIINLPPIDENGTEATAQSLEAVGEIDGGCVVAAATGAAAGAIAHSDNTCTPSALDRYDFSASNYPSEFIPVKDAPTVNTIVESSNFFPREIVTGPAAAANATPAVDDKPSAVDAASAPGEMNSYPTEIVVYRERESVKNLATAGPNESILSLLEQDAPAGCLPPTPTVCEREEMARRETIPSVGGGGPTLPREVLALLEEREGLGPTSSEEAMALLPNEIILKVENTLSDDHREATQNYDRPPREIVSPALAFNHEHISSLFGGMRSILDEYKRRNDIFQDGATDSDCLNYNPDVPGSLPSQVVAPRLSSDEEDEPYAGVGAYAGPDEIPRLGVVSTTYNGSSTGDYAVDGRAQQAPPKFGVKKMRNTTPFSRTSPVAERFRRNAGIGNHLTPESDPSLQFKVAKSGSVEPNLVPKIFHGTRQNSQDSSFSPHMGSLPSNVVVQLNESTAVPANPPKKTQPLSKSLTSPFPLQFRKSFTVNPADNDNKQNLGESSTAAAHNVVLSESDKPLSLRLVPSQIAVDAPWSHHGGQSNLLPTPKQTIDRPRSPAVKQFKKPVASPLFQARAKKNLPPPHPASNPKPMVVPAASPRSERMNKAMSRWKERRSARSNSLVDEFDGDDDDDDVDEEGVTDSENELVSYSE